MVDCITAQEADTLTKEYAEKRIIADVDIIMLNNLITATAQAGKRNCTISHSMFLTSVEHVMNFLEQQGYSVYGLDEHSIEIYW